MMNNYNKMKWQLKSLREINKNLENDVDLLTNINMSTAKLKEEKENENENLQQLIMVSNELNILMTKMMRLCDEETFVGTAYICAILHYQKVLAERLRDSNNVTTQSNESWNSQTQMN